MVNLSN